MCVCVCRSIYELIRASARGKSIIFKSRMEPGKLLDSKKERVRLQRSERSADYHQSQPTTDTLLFSFLLSVLGSFRVSTIVEDDCQSSRVWTICSFLLFATDTQLTF